MRKLQFRDKMESPGHGKAKYIRIKPTARIETKEVLGDLIIVDASSKKKGHTSCRPKETLGSLKNSSIIVSHTMPE